MSKQVRSTVASGGSRIPEGGDAWEDLDSSFYGCSNSECKSLNSDLHEASTTSDVVKGTDYSKRECISIHLGQAGVQMSSACWQLYCQEHNIGLDGRSTDTAGDSGAAAFFQETGFGKFVPRAILVDLEPSVVDKVRTREFRGLYRKAQLLTGCEDAANNYARGFYTIGKTMLDPVMDLIHRMTDDCDGFQGFFLFHSLGGGTGSGFAARLLQTLDQEFPKKSKLEFLVYPTPKVSSAVVEPYNAVLTTHSCMDFVDCAFMMDNEALYEACVRRLEICRPTFSQLNSLIGQVASSVTASMRFNGTLNVDMNEFQTNLVPYHRLHFLMTSFAPLLSHRIVNHETVSVRDITSKCFENSHRLVRCDISRGKYMACCLLYRGDIATRDVNSSIAWIKKKKDIKFVDWCSTGFKVGINYQMPCMAKDGNMAQVRRAACMMSNNTAIAEAWYELGQKFDLMHIKKAFVHWYMMEGLSEEEFKEASDDLAVLRLDYEEAKKDIV